MKRWPHNSQDRLPLPQLLGHIEAGLLVVLALQPSLADRRRAGANLLFGVDLPGRAGDTRGWWRCGVWIIVVDGFRSRRRRGRSGGCDRCNTVCQLRITWHQMPVHALCAALPGGDQDAAPLSLIEDQILSTGRDPVHGHRAVDRVGGAGPERGNALLATERQNRHGLQCRSRHREAASPRSRVETMGQPVQVDQVVPPGQFTRFLRDSNRL